MPAIAEYGRIELRSEHLSVYILAERGAQIEQIHDNVFDVNWLAAFGRTPEPITKAFADGTRAGFDDCMPSIAPCADPNAGRPGSMIADHGDFWSAPWSVCSQSETAAALDTRDIDHPLLVRKSIKLAVDRPCLYIRYQLRNRSDHPYRYLYSAHPLFAWRSDARLVLPAGAPMSVAFGGGIAADGSSGHWPWLPGCTSPFDVSYVPFHGDRVNYKVFVRSSGSCTLQFAGCDQELTMQYSPARLTWLGICVNRGAWPDRAAQESWIALEPATAPADSLIDAIARGEESVLGPGQATSWTLRLKLRPKTLTAP